MKKINFGENRQRLPKVIGRYVISQRILCGMGWRCVENQSYQVRWCVEDRRVESAIFSLLNRTGANMLSNHRGSQRKCRTPFRQLSRDCFERNQISQLWHVWVVKEHLLLGMCLKIYILYIFVLYFLYTALFSLMRKKILYCIVLYCIVLE